ncbi:MAG TPA: four helix bundle protein [Gemmatimonadales bacterium]|nr:four helix bundle protein [Gemmatimonadales bacterium]
MPSSSVATANGKRFEALKAWQAAHALALAIYRATSHWPREERFGLSSQARRAAVSVSANIAEGSAKRGNREFRRFLDMALGSLAEVQVYLLMAKELGYSTPAEWGEIEALRDHAGMLTWGLYHSIGARESPK